MKNIASYILLTIVLCVAMCRQWNVPYKYLIYTEQPFKSYISDVIIYSDNIMKFTDKLTGDTITMKSFEPVIIKN